MDNQLKPYPSYRHSALPWLTSLPESWTVRRIKYVLREKDRRSEDGDGVLLSLTRTRGLIRQADFSTKASTAQTLVGYKLCAPDDVVMNRMQAWSGMFGIAREPGLVSPDYAVFEALGDQDPLFLLYSVCSPGLVSQFAAESKGIGSGFNRLYTDRFGAISIPLPPHDDAAAIVRYVGWVDEQVNRFIKNKRRLVAVLAEQREAVIRGAITKGLDPGTSFKPTGVHWLGEVPEHWQVRRVKHISKILRGKFSHRPRNDPELYDGQYPFLQTGDVARASKYITSFSQSLNDKGFAVSKMFPRGTLVMTIAANIGAVAILDFDACFPDSVVGFVPSEAVERDFLYYVFVSMKADLLLEAPVNTQGNLNIERIGSMVVPIPPLSEQKQIVKSVESDCRLLDVTLATARQEIRLVGEYRTRLVADVVTGKLDVREAAANLPDLSNDVEILDQLKLDAPEEFENAELDDVDEVPA